MIGAKPLSGTLGVQLSFMGVGVVPPGGARGRSALQSIMAVAGMDIVNNAKVEEIEMRNGRWEQMVLA